MLENTATPLATPTLSPALTSLTPASTFTLAPGETAASTETPAPTNTPTITPTPSPSLTPSMTPDPLVRLEMGLQAFKNQNYPSAIDHLSTGLAAQDGLSAARQRSARLALGRSYLAQGDIEQAITVLELVEGEPSASYFLGEAYASQGQCEPAIEQYQAYLTGEALLTPYINTAIAECYFALGQTDMALQTYEDALAFPSHRIQTVQIREALASNYQALGRSEDALRHLNAILDVALTDFTRSRALKAAGDIELARNNSDAAHSYYLRAVNSHPASGASYEALVTLVAAGVPVDEFQRGLVDYYAEAFLPCVQAFTRYLASDIEAKNPEAWLYLAWCYEGLDDNAAALSTLDEYAAIQPARALYEQAKLLARSGNLEAALENFILYMDIYPEGENAVSAAGEAAQLAIQNDDFEQAIALYRRLADEYSWHDDAPRALFTAGLLAYRLDDVDLAHTIWTDLVTAFPAHQYGAAGLIWLAGESASEGSSAETFSLRAETLTGVNYYSLRAREVAGGSEPFALDTPFSIPSDDQEAVADWMHVRFEIDERVTVPQLPPAVSGDGRLIRGELLWSLGRFAAAMDEWESLRQSYTDNARVSYALSLYFREQGNYQSSILAAQTVQILSGESILQVPRSLARLIYPVYYVDLVLPLARQYQLDPRLLFALVRQESLFTGFASSTAAAMGLAQVIPDTGQYIAERLEWPDYQTSHLFRPYVGLTFGAYYLGEQLATFDGDVYAALAAYNAGPGNAFRWSQAAGDNPDLFVELVNFRETRTYIERIYVGYHIYHVIYGP